MESFKDSSGVAVLDLGSNSFHLLVAGLRADGSLEERVSAKRMVRLGSHTLVKGTMDDAVFALALETVGELVAIARAAAPQGIVAVATSAIREAANGGAFVVAARQRFGVTIEVLSGEDEARLVYAGARSTLPEDAGRVAVIDVGGGSVEVAVGDDEERCLLLHSLPLGVLRLRDTLASEPGPLPVARMHEVAGLVHLEAGAVVRQIRELRPTAFVFTSGTARLLASLAERIGLSTGDPAGIGRGAVRRLAQELPRLDPHALLELGVDPARVDTVAVGAMVVSSLVELLDAQSIQVARAALREGVAWRELRLARRSPVSASREKHLPVGANP